MSQLKYKIYPSLLDAFQSYLDTTPENFWYQDENGGWHKNYKESTEEYYYSDEQVQELAKQDMIDRINRVFKGSVAASKGTAFNELVDSFITKKRSDRLQNIVGVRSEDTISCDCDNIHFEFSFQFVEDAAKYFDGSLGQVFTTATIETDYGMVELYGYVDEINKDKVYDIKTTSRPYGFGDYSKKWQRHIYPYCLTESGQCKDISSFEYTVFSLSGGTDRMPKISGKMYKEEYTYVHDYSRKEIKLFCERFIEFLEENRERITDKKIFAQ